MVNFLLFEVEDGRFIAIKNSCLFDTIAFYYAFSGTFIVHHCSKRRGFKGITPGNPSWSVVAGDVFFL